MAKSEKLSLILRPPGAIDMAESGARRVESVIVVDMLALAKERQSTPIDARFRIGQYEWCEPDYRQILIWAHALKLDPEEVIHRLLNGPRGSKESWRETRFETGRLLKI